MKFVHFTLMCIIVISVVGVSCYGDTFTNRITREVLHGYIKSQAVDSNNLIQTEERGLLQVNLGRWDVKADLRGRNNKLVVISLEGDIAYEIETQAFEQSILQVSDEGPLFVLLEIDTPGGRVDLAYRICAAITATRYCKTIAFIKSGQYGGALSAGAAVSLACDKIYMSENSVIGAATMMAVGFDTGIKTMKDAYGEELGEKFESAWRATLASLAQKNNRPGILARAMVDKDIQVVEVTDLNGDNQKMFIDPINIKANQRIVRTWSKEGSLLTLTAKEAVECGIANKVASTRQEVLEDLNVADAEIVINDDIQKAKMELARALGQCKRIRKSLDLKEQQLQIPMRRGKAVKLLREIRNGFKTLIHLAKEYPDLGLNVQLLEDELNTVQARLDMRK